MIKNSKKLKLFISTLFFCFNSYSQNINGVVIDESTNETLLGANIRIIGGSGATSDINGEFTLQGIKDFPIEIECSYIGYETQIKEIKNFDKIIIKLTQDKLQLKEVEVIDNRLTERLQQSPITIEALDINAIKETPAASFYEGLSNLKGVDLTSASLGFKIINTRGFNSTSPVRSLQLIDGVDNQSPGLNFSLGNFMGTGELDTKGVEIIVGANSALYGPNAFNGVIYMETKDPFLFPGTSYQLKVGEQALVENAFRFAKVYKDKDGKEKFALKINLQYFKANDWEADNLSPSDGSPSEMNNFGGYDAVNVYGDEYYQSYVFTSAPGLGTIHRTGYAEEYLVDYDTKNLKFNTAFHYKTNNDAEIIYSFNYGEGTTVYQGDNRYSLKGIKFLQNRIEYRKKDKFYIRLYSTHEDAGDSYDAVSTAISLLDKSHSNPRWAALYYNYWTNPNNGIMSLIENEIPGWQDWDGNTNTLGEWITTMENLINSNPELLQNYHNMAVEYVNNNYDTDGGNSSAPLLQPGTNEFEQAFNEIISTTRYDPETGNLVGGTKFYDKSALYHLQGEYIFDINNIGRLTVGANARLYTPDSNGSIFDDGFDEVYDFIFDENGDTITNVIISGFNPLNPWEVTYDTVPVLDTSYVRKKIKNFEYGIYAGFDANLLKETVLLNATLRMDKNQNFDYLFSPAASIVWKASEKDLIRLSFSSALRNPTLTDQYLNYDYGTGILLGNLNGFGYNEYFVDADSLRTWANYNGVNDPLIQELANNALTNGRLYIDPIKPEKVKTIELGFRTTLWEKLYVDASYYFSTYKDFIGYQIGASYTTTQTSELVANENDVENGWAENIGDTIDNYFAVNMPSIQGYRLAVNAKGIVNTQGFSIGMNYFLPKSYTLNFNYSWNILINNDDRDPIIPAYNTPEHKFNIGLSGKVSDLFNFQINYKWIEGFLFEGSPQFTGFVNSYGLLDLQMNKSIDITNEIPLTIKLGSSNILNNQVYQAYGGPRIGRLSYLALLFEL